MNYHVANPYRRATQTRRPTPTTTVNTSARFNTVEHVDYWKIQVAVPGLDKEDLQIGLDQNVLMVKSIQNNNEEQQKTTAKIHLNEWRSKSVDLSFHLPKGSDDTAISADCAQGVLTITIPKKKAASINIK